jgi:antitoxin component YwqK of YwqJK toxin-antitoxin module
VQEANEHIVYFSCERGEMHKPLELSAELAETHELVRDFYEGGKTLRHEFIRRKSDQRQDGPYRAFYPNGQLWCEEIRKNGEVWETIQDLLPDGKTLEGSGLKAGSGHLKITEADGTVTKEGDCKDGLKEGLWRSYHKSGSLESEGNYHKGLATGEWRYFHENGKLSKSGAFIGGASEGEWVHFYESGTESSRGIIHQGKKVGQWKYRDKDNNYLGEENFKEGKRHGLDLTMHPNGKVKIEGMYEDDLRVGTWKYYYPSGALERELPHIAGKIQGNDKTYHENGQLLSDAHYEGGLRCGTWKRYSSNGALETESDYTPSPIGGYTRVFDAAGKIIKEGPVVYDEDLKKWGWSGLWRYYEADGRVHIYSYKYESDEVKTIREYYDPAPLRKILQDEPAEKQLSLMLQSMKGSRDQLYKSLEVLFEEGVTAPLELMVSLVLTAPAGHLVQAQRWLPRKEEALALLKKQPKDQTEWPACGALILSLHSLQPEAELSEEYDLCLGQALYWSDLRSCAVEALRDVLRKVPMERQEELVFQKMPSQPLQDNRLLIEFAGVCQTPRVLQGLLSVTLARQSYQLDRVSGKSLLQAIVSFGDAVVAPTEQALKLTKKRDTRGFLVEALANSKSLSAAETLFTYTRSKNTNVATIAKDGLIAMGDALLPTLEGWMVSRASSKREGAAKILMSMPKTDAVDKMIAAIKSRAKPDVKKILSGAA